MRIFLALFILLPMVSCSSKPEPSAVTAPLPQKQTVKTPNRSVVQYDSDCNVPSRPFGYILCEGDTLPICFYHREAGFFRPEPWGGFWTDGSRSEMQILIPHFMLKKDIVLEIPVLSYAFFGKQQNFVAEFKVHEKTILRREFTRKSPRSLKLAVPAELNQTSQLTLTIHFITRLQKLSELVPQRKDPRILGMAFHFLKKNAEIPDFSRCTFRITTVSEPDKAGIQQAELVFRDHFSGPEPPEVLKTELYTAAIDLKDPVPSGGIAGFDDDVQKKPLAGHLWRSRS